MKLVFLNLVLAFRVKIPHGVQNGVRFTFGVHVWPIPGMLVTEISLSRGLYLPEARLNIETEDGLR